MMARTVWDGCRAVVAMVVLLIGAASAGQRGAVSSASREQPGTQPPSQGRTDRQLVFRASIAKVEITPQKPTWLSGYGPRQSDGVLDPIYHKVVALDAGGTPFYLISSDLCLFSPAFYDSVMRELQKATGIDPKHVLWSVTHSHSAPEIGPPDMYKALLGRSDHEWDREYTSFATRALLEAVSRARERLEPARIGFGTGTSMANINRRAKDVDGRVSIGLNPDGPVDRQFNLIRLSRPDGSLIALVANYAMHGTVMNGQNLKVSGDAPGVVAAYLEERLGAPVLYINGAAGNIAPIYSVYPSASAGHLSEFRVLLGDRILSAVQALGAGTGDVTIRHGERDRGDAPKAGTRLARGPRGLRQDRRRATARAAAHPVRSHQRHVDLVRPGRDVLRHRDGRAGAVSVRPHVLLRIHERLVRIPPYRQGFRGGRIRAANFPVHATGGVGPPAGGHDVH